MSPEEGARRLERTAAGIPAAARKALKRSAERALVHARDLSTGGISTPELRRLGHPYAKRRPAPPLDPALINLQEGDFFEGWELEGPLDYGGDLLATVHNASKEAEFVLSEGGTELMIERPLPERVLERTAEYFEAELEREIDRAL